MRLVCILLLVLVGAISLAALDAGAQPSRACRPHGSKTIRENSRARIFFDGDSYYGCSFRSGRKTVLGDENHSSSCSCTVSQVRLKRDTAAVQVVDEVPQMYAVFDSFLVVNLRAGRILLDHALPRNREAVHLVLKPNGSVGWLERNPARSIPGPPSYRVRRHDRHGFATLDAGAGDAAPHSLSLRNSVLHWTKGGVSKHARLR